MTEAGGANTKPVLSRKPERQVSDLSAMRPKNSKNIQRPQHMGPDNVEGILTLQLSHPNVMQTFKAATRPLQVSCTAVERRRGGGSVGAKGKGVIRQALFRQASLLAQYRAYLQGCNNNSSDGLHWKKRGRGLLRGDCGLGKGRNFKCSSWLHCLQRH